MKNKTNCNLSPMNKITESNTNTIQIKNYKKLYDKQKQRNEILLFCLEKNKNKLHELNLLLKTKEIEIEDYKGKILSTKNSQTAKNGYKEEQLVCNDLNNENIKNVFEPMLGGDYNECSLVTGNYKSDIQSENNKLRAQVKKYKRGQFQQLDRHWISNIIENIPELIEVSDILKDLFEYPLLSNGTHVDKSKKIKKLCNSNYSQHTLDNLLNLLNINKKKILEYAFYGSNLEIQPEYLFGVEYENSKRNKIVVFKIEDIIKYLETFNFKISPKKTCILLGNNSTLSLQRKGGDAGRKSSNQLQIKLILSNLIDKVPILEYKL